MKNRKLQRVLTWILTLTMILGTFGETGFAVKAADPDEEIEVSPEEADVPDPDESHLDSPLIFKAEANAHAIFVTVNGSVPALAATVTNENIDGETGNDNYTPITSDIDYEFYVVPEVGYDLAETPVEFKGATTHYESATAKIDNDGTDMEISDADWTVSDLDEPGVAGKLAAGATDDEGVFLVGNSTAVLSTLNPDVTAYNWDNAKKVTVKGNTDFLKNYAVAWNKLDLASGTNTTLTDVKEYFSVTAKATPAATYDLPVYVSEVVEGKTVYTKLEGRLDDKLTFGVKRDGSDVNHPLIELDAITEDWSEYDAAGVKMAMLKSDLSAAVSFTATTDYVFSTTAHTLAISADTTKAAYLDMIKNGNIPAIIVPKSAAVSEYALTAVDNSAVKFTIADADAFVTTAEAVDIFVAPVEGESSVAYTPDAAHRTFGGIFYTIAGDDADKDGKDDEHEATLVEATTGYYVIPDGRAAGDITVYAKSYETVKITDKGYANNKQSVTLYVGKDTQPTASTAGVWTFTSVTKTNGVKTDDAFSFALYPSVNAGAGTTDATYIIESVMAKVYTLAGTQQESTITLEPVDSVYTIPSVGSYVEVEITTKAMVGTNTVKLSDTTNKDGENAINPVAVKVYDVNSGLEIDTTGAMYAELGQPYQFVVKEMRGDYRVTAVTATMNGEDTAVTYDAATGLATIAAANNGTIVIDVATEKCFGLTKVPNKNAILSVNGSVLEDGKTVKLDDKTKVNMTISTATGVNVEAVFYGNAGGATWNPQTNTLAGCHLIEAVDGVYSISAPDAFGTANVYVFTSYDAVEGTDFTAVLKKGDTDVTNGLTLYAGGKNDGITEGRADVVPTFTLADGKKPTTNPAFTLALNEANAAEEAAEVPVDERTKIIAKVTSVDVGDPAKKAAHIVTENWTGAEGDETTSDVMTVEYFEPTENALHFTRYSKDMPLTVKPLSSLHSVFELAGVFKDINNDPLTVVPDKTIRRYKAGAFADYATYTVVGVVGDPEKVQKAEVKTPYVATNGIEWKTTPAPGTASQYATYQLNDNTENVKVAANAKIDEAKKLQTINVTATVTFVDGSKRSTSDDLNVIPEDYGYFALTTTQLQYGDALVSTTATTLELETDGRVKNANVSFEVFHALTAEGLAAIKAITVLDKTKESEKRLAKFIKNGDIERVDASEVTWTAFGPKNTKLDLSKYVTLTGSNGNYALAAVSKTDAIPLALSATVGDYKVAELTVTSVKVVKTKHRYDVMLDLADDSVADAALKAREGYTTPTFKDDFTLVEGITMVDDLDDYEAIGDKDDDDIFWLVDVPNGTALTLPGIDAFTGVDPKRDLAGWAVGHYTTGQDPVLVEEAYNVGAVVTLGDGAVATVRPIWAPKYDKISDMMAGKAINGNTGLAFSTTETIIAKDAEAPVWVALYGLDLDNFRKTNTADLTPAYVTTEPVIVKEGIALEAKDNDSAKALGGDGSSKNIPNSLMKGVLTGNPGDVAWTYSEGEDAEYTGVIKNVIVQTPSPWEVTIADIELEATELVNIDLKTSDKVTVTKSGSAVVDANGDEDKLANAEIGALTIVDFDESTVSARIYEKNYAAAGQTADKRPTLELLGIKVGTTTAKVEFVTGEQVKVSVPVKITVKPANVKIGMEVTPKTNVDLSKVNPAAFASITAEDDVVVVDEAAAAEISVKGSYVRLFAKDKEGAAINTVTFEATAVPYTTEERKVFVESGMTPQEEYEAGYRAAFNDGFITNENLPDGYTYLIRPEYLGTATMFVIATVGDQKYVREIPVTTYSEIVVYGPKANTNIYNTAIKEEEAFKLYTTADKTVEVAKQKYSVVRIPYNREMSKEDEYTVNAIAAFTADWIDTTKTQILLGFGETKAACDVAYDANIYAAAGEALVLSEVNAKAGKDVYAQFATTPLDVKELPEFIELSDENVDPSPNATDTTKTYTNWATISFRVEPSQATTATAVSATEKGFLDLARVYPEGTEATVINTAEATVGKLEGNTHKLAITGTADDVNVIGRWNGTAELTLIKKSGKGATENDRYDSFLIGKVPGEAGVATLYVTGGREPAAVPVYINGQINKGTQEKPEYYYMYRGEIQKSKIFTVEGKKRVYGEDGLRVENDVVEIDGKLVLVVNGEQVTKPGLATANDGRMFLVQEDGTLFTNGIAEVAGINRLFREDGSMVFYNDSDVVDGKINVGGVDYVIDPNTNEAAEDDRIAIVDYKWAAWPKAKDAKITEMTHTLTATLSSQKGKTIEDNPRTIEAVVTYERNANNTEITFTATADVSRYYDKDFATKLTTVVDTKTYKLDENGNITDGGREVPISQDGSIVIVGLEEVYYYTSVAIKPSFIVRDESRDVVLVKGVDYTVKFKDNKKVGTGKVIIKGKGSYTGENTTATFEIKDPYAVTKEESGLDDVVAGVKKVKAGDKLAYNGLAQYPASLTVTLADNSTVTLTHEGDGEYTSSSDKNVILSFCNNTDKGTATVAAVGADGKVKKASYKITVADFGTAKATEGMEGTYSVKGASANDLAVTWTNADGDEFELVEGQDYKVSYDKKSIKAAGTGSMKISGKGNFKGNISASFTINALTPDKIDAVAAYDGVKASAVKVTILDEKGFALNQKKQLDVQILDAEGNAIDGKTKLAAGQKITVVVKSKDAANVAIGEDGISEEVTVGQNLAKAKIDAKKLTVNYSGSPIELTGEQMASVIVTIGKKADAKTLVYGEDFEIVGYTNNVKKGTMTVTIKGTGEETERGTFSGVKTFKVKIVAKNIQ